LSKRYVNTATKLRWRCAKGHEWSASPSNIRRGHWCMICGNRRQGRLKAHTIQMMQKIAAQRGGECLSTEYRNNTTKLQWRCKEGHEWEAVPGSIVGTRHRKGRWCAACVGKLPKTEAFRQLRELAAKRGGMLLSKQYQNAKSHLRWKCARGHEWKAASDGVKHGQWCPVCAGSFPLNIALMRKAARAFDGCCLSRKYVNVDTHLRWRCAGGHEWLAIGNSIRRGSWCPICAGRRPKSTQS
jgi:hypothetical protein